MQRHPPRVQQRYEALKAYLRTLGPETETEYEVLRDYFAFRRVHPQPSQGPKNYAVAQICSGTGVIKVYVHLNPDHEVLREGFTRDVRGMSHESKGELEITIRDLPTLEEAKPLLAKSYTQN